LCIYTSSPNGGKTGVKLILAKQTLNNPASGDITVVDMQEGSDDEKEIEKTTKEAKTASESKWAKLKVDDLPAKEKDKDRDKGKSKGICS
jgi:hypothetical protein